MSTKHDAGSSKLLAELHHLSGTDPMLKEMIDQKMPLDRETYIAMNWGPDVPKPWTAEDEDQLPVPFQKDPPKEY